jgi:hypothetical protein
MKRQLVLIALVCAGLFGSSREALAQVRAGARAGRVAVGPGGGVAASRSAGRVAAGPFGAAAGGARRGTVVTPGGATV